MPTDPTTGLPVIGKVAAYITHQSQPHTTRLLVFTHPHATEAGVQVPAGTIEPGEAPEVAVMREAFEETGLHGLMMVGKLGAAHHDMRPWGKDEIHHRHTYHLAAPDDVPEAWQHGERAPDGSWRHVFEFKWAALPLTNITLSGAQGHFLDILIVKLKLNL